MNPTILLSHQTRSVASDELLFSLLGENGFRVTELPQSMHHPEFRTPALRLFSIRRLD